MTKMILSIKWNTHGNEAEQLVNKALEHLDGRKKHLKDDTLNRRIVSSIVAQRTGDFTVSYGAISKAHTEALKAALECLTGPVLTRSNGRSTYALREAYMAPDARFITDAIEATVKRPTPAITTRFGTIYRDGSHSEIAFEDIRLFGFSKPSLVRIISPHQHWHMFLDNVAVPSASWKDLFEATEPHPKHDELMDYIADQGTMRGVAVARYGHDSFLAINPEMTIFTIDNSILRYAGKAGLRPLLNITDIYQRTHMRWGNKAHSPQDGALRANSGVVAA